MNYPLDTLKNPKVILDYSGYLAAHPEEISKIGDVRVIAYNPGSSHPTYAMCDTVAMFAKPEDDLDDLYRAARRAAPFSHQAVFYGKGVSAYGSRETTCAVCVDRNIRFRQKHLC